MDCNKSIWKVTGPFPFGFQNGNIHYVYDAKDCYKVTYSESYWSMFLLQPLFQNATTLNIFWPVSHLLGYLKRLKWWQ